jgi:hypothetical protein
MALFTNLAFADGSSYGGRHEIAIDGNWNGSFRHVHNWNTEKNRKLYFDISNHDRFFTSDNDFSYVEFVDRRGNILFHAPSPAFTKLWSYKDSYFIGMSNIKLYNPYQIVVWRGDGTILYKLHISSQVAKLTSKQEVEFKLKFPEAEKLLKSHYFTYSNITYCDCLHLGVPNQIGKEATDYLVKLLVTHPYIQSSESTTNYVFWTNGEPYVNEEKKVLSIPTIKGDPIIINLDKSIQMLGPVGTFKDRKRN